MGFMDKAKDLAGKHEKQADQGIEKAGDAVDERTGDKHKEHVDKGQDAVSDKLGIGDETAGGDTSGEKGGQG